MNDFYYVNWENPIYDHYDDFDTEAAEHAAVPAELLAEFNPRLNKEELAQVPVLGRVYIEKKF